MIHSVNEIILRGGIYVDCAVYPEMLYLPAWPAVLHFVTVSDEVFEGLRSFMLLFVEDLAGSALALQSKSLLLTGSEKLGFGLLGGWEAKSGFARP